MSVHGPPTTNVNYVWVRSIERKHCFYSENLQVAKIPSVQIESFSAGFKIQTAELLWRHILRKVLAIMTLCLSNLCGFYFYTYGHNNDASKND